MKQEEFNSFSVQFTSYLHLECSVKAAAESLFREYLLSTGECPEPVRFRCAVLTALKTQNARGPCPEKASTFPLKVLLRGPCPVDIRTFMFKLKEFINVVVPNEQTRSYFQRYINSLAFSLTLFNKYEEIWQGLEISAVDAGKYMKFGWMLFVLARINLLQRRNGIVECACMLIGTFIFLLDHLPETVTRAVSVQRSELALTHLCGVLRANVQQVNISSTHMCSMVEEYRKHDILRGTVPNSMVLDGILSYAHLEHNLAGLSTQYEQKLLPDDIDEREFFYKEDMDEVCGSGVLGSIHRFSYIRPMPYIDDESISMDSKLSDLQFKESGAGTYQYTPPTPMSTGAEMRVWLNNSVDDSNQVPTSLLELMDGEAQRLFTQTLAHFEGKLAGEMEKIGIATEGNSSFLTENFLIANEESRQEPQDRKLKTTFKLFYTVLLELVHSENRQSEHSLSSILKNETFYRALMACCLETILFIHNSTALDFEEVLVLCGVSAFDAWKLMQKFTEFDPRFPSKLKEYFRGLKQRIVAYIAWDESSPVPAIVKSYLSGESRTENPAEIRFCRNTLAYSAYKILEVSELLGLSEQVREEVWSVMKYALATQTELFISRHLDQVIVCSVYGVCKAMNLSVTFNNLIAKYWERGNDNKGGIFRHVRIDKAGTVADIITFYNKVYVKHVRCVLLELSKSAPPLATQPRHVQPTFPVESPFFGWAYQSPSKSLGASQFGTPLTPQSRGFYIIGESPSANLDGINQMLSKPENLFGSPRVPLKRPPSEDLESVESIPEKLDKDWESMK